MASKTKSAKVGDNGISGARSKKPAGYPCPLLPPLDSDGQEFRLIDASMCGLMCIKPNHVQGKCVTCPSPFRVCYACYLQLGAQAQQSPDCLVTNPKTGTCLFHNQHGVSANRGDNGKPKPRVQPIGRQLLDHEESRFAELDATRNDALLGGGIRTQERRQLRQETTKRGRKSVSSSPSRRRQPRRPVLAPGSVLPSSQPGKPIVTAVASAEEDSRPNVEAVHQALEKLKIPGLYESMQDCTMRTYAVDEMEPNPEQPRQTFDEQDLRAFGEELSLVQLEPVILVPIATNGKPHMILDGERRWRAAKFVGLKTLWGVVVNITDLDVIFLHSFFANTNREGYTEIDEALAIQKMLNRQLLTKEQIANRLNRSVGHVNNRLSLLKLNPEVQAMVGSRVPSEKRLGSYAALHISNLVKDQALQLAIALEIVSKQIKTNVVYSYIRRRLQQQDVVPGGRQRTPWDDYKKLRDFLVRTENTLEQFMLMKPQEIRELFGRRNATDLNATINEIDELATDLLRLLAMLQEIKGATFDFEELVEKLRSIFGAPLHSTLTLEAVGESNLVAP